jgi:hypothetical protein
MRRFASALPLLLALAGCRSSQPTRFQVDPALLMLVPADTETLGGAKLDKLRASAVYKKMGARLEARWADLITQRTGVDPRKDVWEVAGALRPGEQSLFLARGKFTPDGGMEPRLAELGASRSSYRGYTLIGSDRAAVTFLNPSTLAAGRPDSVRSLLDARGKMDGPPPALAAMLRNLPAASQLWVVSRTGAQRAAEHAPVGHAGQVAQMLTAVRSYWGGATLSDGLEAHGQIECATEADAAALVRAAKGVVGMGRLNTPDNQPELLRFFDGIQIEQQQKVVTVDVRASAEALEKAMEFAGRFSGGAGSMPSVPGLLK